VTDPDGNPSDITPVNNPRADNDADSMSEVTPLTVPVGTSVLDGDTDPEGTSLTAGLVAGPVTAP